MTTRSQSINPSYGYLWWLNGKSSYKLPGLQFSFQGSLIPHAPDDLFSAMGKNGQFICVIPSQNMVWVRFGDNPDNSLVPYLLNADIWKYINDLKCHSTNTSDHISKQIRITYHSSYTRINSIEKITSCKLFDLSGKNIFESKPNDYEFNINSQFISGIYFLQLEYKVSSDIEFKSYELKK